MHAIDQTIITDPPSFDDLFDDDPAIRAELEQAFGDLLMPDATPPPPPPIANLHSLLAHADELLMALDNPPAEESSIVVSDDLADPEPPFYALADAEPAPVHAVADEEGARFRALAVAEPAPFQTLPAEPAPFRALAAEPAPLHAEPAPLHAEPAPVLAYEPAPFRALADEEPAPLPSAPFQRPAAEELDAPVAAEPAADAVPTRVGEVITLFGCRGGCGATTIAVNLAGSLAAQGKQVCIVDLDVQLGDVLVSLDLDADGTASLVSLAREAHQLDPDMLKRRLARHEEGVFVLAQGGRLEEIDDTLPSKIPGLLATLAHHFDVVIIDGISDFSELALSAIDAANVVALVLTQDVLAVRRARRVIDICRKLEVPDHKIKPILNSYKKRARIDIGSISAGLTLDVAATIVEDERTIRRARIAGQLLQRVARRRRITRDVAALHELVAGEQP